MFLGDKYAGLQTSLSVASDDRDDATNNNIENLKAQAKKLIPTHTAEIEITYTLLKTGACSNRPTEVSVGRIKEYGHFREMFVMQSFFR